VRRVVASQDGVRIEVVDAPEPAAGEALVETMLVGVCGSDLHAAHGRHPFVPLPYLPGHEVVGRVRDVGPDVSGIRPGQRVVVEPTLPCRVCKMCVTGRENLCENLRFFGCGYPQGAMADLFTVAVDRLHVVPDGLADRAAVLIEPLSTPIHAARLAGGVRGKAVVILGAGTIGLLMLAVARDQQAGRIVVTDVRAGKRDRALRLGADVAIDAGDPDAPGQVRAALGESADVVFDCVASQSTVTSAMSMADKGGTVVVVGVPTADVVVPLPVIQDHQIRMQGSATYLPADFADAVDMLVRGVLNPADIVTAEFPLDRAAAAFDLASGGGQVKVVLSAAAVGDTVPL
jgi:2-desacetyl-2-hydroxyethyl bacteriochlorophyllide A dehydrogenase